MNTDAHDHLVVMMTILLAILAMALTLILIAGQRAIRRRLAERRSQSPEYWRMYARVCDVTAEAPRRELQRVPDIDDLR